MELAGKFKAGANKAIENIMKWLFKETISHVKNSYPIQSGMGCEGYAYFDKYMITVASFIYVAYMFQNSNIIPIENTEPAQAFSLTRYFNKTFLKNENWFVEIDDNADTHYDANGIGRVHYKGAPSAICLSVPGTKTPSYKSAIDENIDFAIVPGVSNRDEILFAFRDNADYILKEKYATDKTASAVYECGFSNWKKVAFSCEVNLDNVTVSASSDKDVYLMLPAFFFDGQTYTEIKLSENILEVYYNGYVCRYISDGNILKAEKQGFNRNGVYDIFYAKGDKEISVKIEIEADSDMER